MSGGPSQALVVFKDPQVISLAAKSASQSRHQTRGSTGHRPPGEGTHCGPHTQEEGAGRAARCSEAGFWAAGWRLFVLDLYHTLRTPAKEVITLLSQNGFWQQVKKSSHFPAK